MMILVSQQGSQETVLLVAALSSYMLALVLARVLSSCMSICSQDIASFAVCHLGRLIPSCMQPKFGNVLYGGR